MDLHNSNFLYRIENVVCPPFRTATLVENETIEGQIGEGCGVGAGRPSLGDTDASLTGSLTDKDR